jgi:hypothetical protein
MRRIVALAGLLLLAGALRAQDAPVDAPQTDAPLRDVEFGVRVRQAGLERRVEMLQWQSTPQGYERVWSDEPIDASDFDHAHANPVDWPLPGRRWLAKSITLDGKPLDPEVVDALGEWRDFRPSFDALPGNMAATFQPEGDGLGSADNPLAPDVGDLRIRWRQLVLPPLQGRVRLQAGRWQLVPAGGEDPAGTSAAVPSPAAAQAPPPAPVADEMPRRHWWFGGGALLVVLVALAARRRRQSRES